MGDGQCLEQQAHSPGMDQSVDGLADCFGLRRRRCRRDERLGPRGETKTAEKETLGNGPPGAGAGALSRHAQSLEVDVVRQVGLARRSQRVGVMVATHRL